MNTNTARPQWRLAEPDPRPGRYFTDCKRGSRTVLLSGPYRYHAEALAALEEDRQKAVAYDEKTWFDLFGTVHIEGARHPRVAFPREGQNGHY